MAATIVRKVKAPFRILSRRTRQADVKLFLHAFRQHWNGFKWVWQYEHDKTFWV